MTSTICGHEREALIWACRFVDSHEVIHCRKWEPAEHEACLDVCNPATLAGLLSSALALFGVGSYGKLTDEGMPVVFLWLAETEACPFAGMPQARSVLLRILELPEGATAEDAVKALVR